MYKNKKKKENNINFKLFLSLANTCIDIVSNSSYVTVGEPIHLICRIRAIKNSNEVNLHVEWKRNDKLLPKNRNDITTNYSSINGILYGILVIKHANQTDTGIYQCQYGPLLTATFQIIVNQCKSFL